jgi:hypothetical protein
MRACVEHVKSVQHVQHEQHEQRVHACGHAYEHVGMRMSMSNGARLYVEQHE